MCFFHAPFGGNGTESDESLRPFLEQGLEVRRINMKHPSSYLKFHKWIRKEQVDILHAHRNLALMFGYYSRLGSRLPPLVVNRGTTDSLTNPLVRRVFRSEGLNRIITVAHAVKESVVADVGIAAERISVVYGSFDEARFHPERDGTSIRRELGVGPLAPLIVCIAAVERRKGLDVLMDAALEVVRKFFEARFLIVGNIDDSIYHQEIQRQVDRLGLSRHVAFAGHWSDIPDILAAADISVSASLVEGLSGALRESLAMRKPVVCTRVGGHSEVIRDGETGWLVEPNNSVALGRAIIEALEHPEEARRRAQKGHELILSLSTNEARCKEVEHIYYSVCRDC